MGILTKVRGWVSIALLVCLNAAAPASFRTEARGGGEGAAAAGRQAAIAATPAKSMSTEGTARTQFIRDAAKAPGQSTTASHQAAAHLALPGLQILAQISAYDRAGEVWRPLSTGHGRAPPTSSLL